jgi:phosphatidylserine/phosphatidylglycerophosphate/cardiolipin synthase-like enzyme
MERARAGVAIDIVSNGIDAGMGDNGRKLRQLAQKFKAKGKKAMAKLIATVERITAVVYARPNHKALKNLSKTPNIDAWEYFGHIHSKQIVFDHILTSTGSFNLDKHSYKNHESTLICMDKTLAQQSLDGFVSDIINSIPVL